LLERNREALPAVGRQGNELLEQAEDAADTDQAANAPLKPLPISTSAVST
jgi:hypothetical protein